MEIATEQSGMDKNKKAEKEVEGLRRGLADALRERNERADNAKSLQASWRNSDLLAVVLEQDFRRSLRSLTERSAIAK